MKSSLISCVLALVLPISASAQSLFLVSARPIKDDHGTRIPGGQLVGYSMLVVEPPRPREWQTHDLLTIIIDESSRQQSDQSLDTEKSYENSATVQAFIDLQKLLLDAQIRQGEISNTDLLDIESDSKYEADGEYERNDRFSDRITAEVIDVKPNGVIVIEAKRTIQTDGESKVLVLSGMCRSEDVSNQNTVRSNQLADLALIVKHEGELSKTAKKGVIPRALETLFNF